jgi:predicted TIM-barrel fold metal-dependent hydrolase
MDLPYEMYDADNHLYEATDCFTRHLPDHRSRDLFWVTDDRGHRHIILDGKLWNYIPNPTFDPVSKAGSLEEMFAGDKSKLQMMADGMRDVEALSLRPEYGDRDKRIEKMDQQGVRAALMHPTLASGIEGYASDNPQLIADVFWAFNRWLEEEWGFAYQDRIFASPMFSLAVPDEAVAMLDWAIERGCRSIYMRPAPAPTELGNRSPGDPMFDPFWARCAEAGILVCTHVGESGYYRYTGDYTGNYRRRAFSLSPFEMIYMHGRTMADYVTALATHGVFTRHPNLRMVSVENGADWLAPLIETCKLFYQRYPGEFPEDPVVAISRNLLMCPFWEDPLQELTELLPINNILAGSDFPHAEGLAEPTDFVKALTSFSTEDERLIMRDNLKGLLAV